MNKTKLLSITTLVVSVITLILAVISFFNQATIDSVMFFLGLTQILSGVNQFELSKQISTTGTPKGNKNLGYFSIVLGIFLIVMVLLKVFIHV